MAEITDKREMQSLFPGTARKKYEAPRMAVITGVDIDKGEVAIRYLESGGIDTVALAQPYIGSRARIGFIPELGSFCLVVASRGRQSIIVAYIPSDYEKLVDVKEKETGLARKLQPGQIVITSSEFGEVFLGDNVEISDKNRNRVIINSVEDKVTVAASKKVVLQASDVGEDEEAEDRIEIIYEDNKIQILAKKDVEIVAQEKAKITGDEVLLNDGDKGVARTDDVVEITPLSDPGFFAWLAQMGYTAAKITAKITGGSETVKAGD